MKVVLPDTYPGQLPQADGVEFVTVSARQPVPDEHLDAEVLVVWRQKPEVLRDAAQRMTRLRLVQALLAGPDMVVAAGFPPEVMIASGVGLHDWTVAEHALGLTIALIRLLPLAMQRQRERRWDHYMKGAILDRADDGRLTSLAGARVTIWGFGSIGSTLAPLYRILGAQVRGIARTAGERDGFEVVAGDRVDEVLAETDILVMILPHSASTRQALDAHRIAQLPTGSLLVNVGRGSTVDEEALLEAVRSGRLAAAALDVVATEPLPAESPLWEEPNVLITPHIASDRPRGAHRLIEDQIEALRGRGQLRNLMPR